MSSSAQPGKPPKLARTAPTRLEAWYLNCLKTWTARTKRAPWLHELAAWLNRSKTAVYSALVSLEHKGWVRRVGSDPGRKADRRFEAVPDGEL